MGCERRGQPSRAYVSFGKKHIGLIQQKHTSPLVSEREMLVEACLNIFWSRSNVTWEKSSQRISSYAAWKRSW